MTQMVLTNGSLPAAESSRISTVAEKPGLAVRVSNLVACSCGLLLGFHFWVASGAAGLAVISLFTIASLAHAWFKSRRTERLAPKPAAATAAIPANQGELS